MPTDLACSVCDKKADGTTALQRCSRCRSCYFCGTDCQKQGWPTHKLTCGKPATATATPQTPQWYDKFRKCQDGTLHEGALELITWPCAAEGTGWGACFADESDGLKKMFEEEYGGDEEKFHAYWPQGFRWTCCGTDAGMDYGCDHHGTGRRACTCDFCRMGKPLPNSIYNKKTAARHGLNLRRGPDPRSFNPGIASIAAMGRTMMGMDF